MRCFVGVQIFSPSQCTDGGVAERRHDDKGGGGVLIPPRRDDFVYEEPLRVPILFEIDFSESDLPYSKSA